MPSVYFNETGVGGGTGTEIDPYTSRDDAVSGSAAGDTIILLDGTHTTADAVGYWNMNDNRIHSAQTYRGATLQADTGTQTTYVARTSSGLSAANNPFLIENVILDGEGVVTQCLEIGSDAAEDLTIHANGLHCKDGKNYCLFINDKRGKQIIQDIKASGSPDGLASTGLIYSTASLSSNGNQETIFRNVELDGTRSSDTLFGMFLAQANSGTPNTLLLSIVGVKGSIASTGTASVVGVNVRSKSCLISGFKATVDGRLSSGIGNYGIWVIGNALNQATDPVITDFDFEFLCKAGYAVSLGTSTTASNVSGGEMSGGYCKGLYDVASTPHGAVMGQGLTGGTMRGVTMDNFYAPFLFSLCAAGTQKSQGCKALNPYGPACYIKGTTAIDVSDFSAYYESHNCTLSVDNGIGCWFVTDQGGTNTSGATLKDHLYVINDPSKLNSFGGYQATQTLTADDFIYIVPEGTVDVVNDDLFCHDVLNQGDAPNNTLAEFNAQAKISNHQIIELPANVVSAIGNAMKREGGTGQQALIGSFIA